MGLVDYSDSEDSGGDHTTAVKAAPQPSKSGFAKVVDRSNPGKIRVSLPQTATVKVDANGDEPPTKRVKLGGGGLTGFNSFLPPPKRTGVVKSGNLGGGGVGRGLGAGVSLKTGAAPGFSRNNDSFVSEDITYGKDSGDASEEQQSFGGGGRMNLPAPKSALAPEPVRKPAEEVKLVGKATMFRPLSVSRKPTKKKKPTEGAAPASSATAGQVSASGTSQQEKPAQPRVSLFSVPDEANERITPSLGTYQPMIYGTKEEKETEVTSAHEDYSTGEYEAASQQADYTNTTTFNNPQSLDNIAADLNLSDAERRKLFGRKNGSMLSATKVINFNTDEEYKHNEVLRSAGEQVVHNPVRALAPGKHSLKQLVNAAATQKEALEESFNKGRANRKEASGRYGW
jgi:hypothetical protein